jgi:hypothetical protein
MNNPHIWMHQSPNSVTAEHKTSLGYHILFNATNILEHGLTHNGSQSKQAELHNSNTNREDQLSFSVMLLLDYFRLTQHEV